MFLIVGLEVEGDGRWSWLLNTFTLLVLVYMS